MKPGQNLTEVTCNVLQGLSPVLESFGPDVILVHGDTTTTMAASMARYHFAPTERASKNLLAEGITGSSVYVTGNMIIDAMHSLVSLPC